MKIKNVALIEKNDKKLKLIKDKKTVKKSKTKIKIIIKIFFFKVTNFKYY